MASSVDAMSDALAAFNRHSWQTRERLGASSPDLPRLLDLLLPAATQDVQDSTARKLQTLLESHV